MHRLPPELLCRIAAYCDPTTMLRLTQTSSTGQAALRRGKGSLLCVADMLLRGLEIDTRHTDADLALLQQILRHDPGWITTLWASLSDHLYQLPPVRRRRGFARPAAHGRYPTLLTFAEARDVTTWTSSSPRRTTGSRRDARGAHQRRRPLYRIMQHEILRLDRLRVRFWRQHAPTGLALIY